MLTISGQEFNGYFKQNHPGVVEQHVDEIEKFARSLHSEVLDPLHTLLAIALELPEDYFTNIHKYEVKSEARDPPPLCSAPF